MRHLKFFSLLEALSKKEVAAFSKYLKQVHENEKIALLLFNRILRSHSGSRDHAAAEPEKAHQRVLKGKTGNDRKNALNSLSELYAWLKSFLLLEKTSDESFESRYLWLKILQERGLQGEFAREVSRFYAWRANVRLKNVTNYLEEVFLRHFVYYHLPQNNLDADNRALLEYEDALDLFYAVAKLKISCEKANRRNVLSMAWEPGAVPFQPAYTGSPATGAHLLLILYSRINDLIANGREEIYDDTEDLVRRHADAIDPVELHRLFSYLHNYASAQLRNKKNEFRSKVHLLNKFGVARSIFRQEGGMSVTQFNNIVSTACKMNDIEWALSFVETESKFLPEGTREDATLLANVTIRFEKKDFKQVISLLRKREFKELLDSIRAKTILAASYYETEDIADLLDHCSIFIAFLKRHHRSSIQAVAASLNFISILKMLIRSSDKKEILAAISNTQPIYMDQWLIDKANEL